MPGGGARGSPEGCERAGHGSRSRVGSATRGSARLRTCPGSAADRLRREPGSRGLGEASRRGDPAGEARGALRGLLRPGPRGGASVPRGYLTEGCLSCCSPTLPPPCLYLQGINRSCLGFRDAVSEEDTLAWRAQGRGTGVLGPRTPGEAVHRLELFFPFRPAQGSVTAVCTRKRPNLVVFLQDPGVKTRPDCFLFFFLF